MDARKKFLTPRFTPLCMATKIKFDHHKVGDKQFFVTNHVTTKKGFDHHLTIKPSQLVIKTHFW